MNDILSVRSVTYLVSLSQASCSMDEGGGGGILLVHVLQARWNFHILDSRIMSCKTFFEDTTVLIRACWFRIGKLVRRFTNAQNQCNIYK